MLQCFRRPDENVYVCVIVRLPRKERTAGWADESDGYEASCLCVCVCVCVCEWGIVDDNRQTTIMEQECINIFSTITTFLFRH